MCQRRLCLRVEVGFYFGSNYDTWVAVDLFAETEIRLKVHYRSLQSIEFREDLCTKNLLDVYILLGFSPGILH
jgi:hypothetical protein